MADCPTVSGRSSCSFTTHRPRPPRKLITAAVLNVLKSLFFRSRRFVADHLHGRPASDQRQPFGLTRGGRPGDPIRTMTARPENACGSLQAGGLEM